jgi:hypothetical protein
MNFSRRMNSFAVRWHPFSRGFLSFSVATLIGFWIVLPGSLFAQSDLPPNLDAGLRQLVNEQQQGHAAAMASTGRGGISQPGLARFAVRDVERRVLVNIHLNGKTSLANVNGELLRENAHVTAESSTYRRGVLSAYVPIDRLVALARSPGVLSISLSRRPFANVGKTTSGGVPVLRSDILNGQGIDGTGITVGVLSDSYDIATLDFDGNPLTIHAADDVASGDLPGPGNINNPNPVLVLDEYDPGPDDSPGFDEGRAMLQIVHDVAPKSKLAFATAFEGEVAFADNIRRLRTEALCDVIVDDVFYFSEPFFSDGIIAQAVDDVVNSTTLPGRKCAYFSSAGNQQGGGYVSSFQAVPDTTARAGIAGQNLDLTQVPAALTSGGFHNFNPSPAANPDISQTFFLAAGTPDEPTSVEIFLQWNDPFDTPGGVTTDYNVLVFDAAGNYLAASSGTEDNFATEEPMEDVFMMNAGAAITFQIAISRAGNSPATPVASKLRYFAVDEFGSGAGAAEYYQPNAPSTFGHNCANGALGTAAYVYDDIPSNPPRPPYMPVIEDFTSAGPATIDFDAAGNRLAQSEIRQKPDIAAPDGGNNTFFGFDFEEDGFPNFFGTSAAAPHAAGVAALLLQKAGGPASLTLAQLKNALQTSVRSFHDIDPFFSQVIAVPRRRARRASGSSMTITAAGNGSNASSRDSNFFTINFAGRPGQAIQYVIINMKEIDLKFDTTTEHGFPFTLGRLVGISPSSIITNATPGTDGFVKLTISFAPHTFTPGASVSFGIDRDFVGDGGANAADLLQKAKVSARTTRGKLFGAFVNKFGSGYSIADGFGLIDAFTAAQRVP